MLLLLLLFLRSMYQQILICCVRLYIQKITTIRIDAQYQTVLDPLDVLTHIPVNTGKISLGTGLDVI